MMEKKYSVTVNGVTMEYPEGTTYEQIAKAIGDELDRGSTFLHGEGAYSHKDTKVILTAVKRQQLSELKELVVGIDPDAFIIVQEAHQVLGDGFVRYSKNAL